MLKVVLRTFREAFFRNGGKALVFIDGYRLALVGLNGVGLNSAGLNSAGLDSEQLFQRWQSMPEKMRDEASGGEGLWTWLGRYWGEIPDFAGMVPVQNEWSPVIEYALPRLRYADGVDGISMWRWLLSWRQDVPQAARELHVDAADFINFKRAWVASAFAVRLLMAELAGDDRQAVKWARLAMRANPLDRWPAFALADRMFMSLAGNLPPGMNRRQALVEILQLRPDHEAALRAMMQLEMQAGHVKAAEDWRRKLAVVSPLAFDVRKR